MTYSGTWHRSLSSPVLLLTLLIWSLSLAGGRLSQGVRSFITKATYIFFRIFEGTVRLDWIYMRVVPLDEPWKGWQQLWVFDFLMSLLNIWKDFRVLSLFMQKWMQPLLYGLYRILFSYWLAHFLWKNPLKCCFILVWIAGRWNSLLTSCNLKNNWCLSRIFGHGSAEKIGVWAHANRYPNKQEVGFIFAWSCSELWTLNKYSRSKIKSQKLIAADVLSRPIQWYHSQADPIWPDGTFKQLNWQSLRLTNNGILILCL